MGRHRLSRRDFVGLAAAGLGGALLGRHLCLGADAPAVEWDPARPPVVTGQPLKVQPVLMYTTFQRREAASWRSWSSINTPQAAAEEQERIAKELKALQAAADFPLEFLPLVAVTVEDQARKVHEAACDAVLLYPATGSAGLLRACFPTQQPRDAVLFARHQSGPTYYWYEALSTSILKKGTEPELAQNNAKNHGPVTVDDVVIDDYAEVRWRLRALYALKNFIGQRIVALGGPQGKYDGKAPQVARERYLLNVVDVPYDLFARRFRELRADARAVAQAEKWTDQYLALPGTTLDAARPAVVNAFLLYAIFKEWLREHRAPAFTINHCMSGVLPIAATTPCMPLSWLNDEGLAAFCESDFVIVPPGLFLHYLAGTPVFLHNSTFPHGGVVTCAHCTAPRRMDGKRYEPARIVTHYESDAGAAPKVDMAVGQTVTFIDPEYSTGRWVGMKGVIKANPSHAICRTQQDVEIAGNWRALLREARDSHWVMVYGDHLAAIAYAARKIGIQWVDLSSTA